MQYIITIAVIFLIMFTAPFVTALIYCSVRKGDVLPIQQSKMKDARYFGKSFARKVDEGLENVREDIIVLSTQEVFIDEDRKALPDGNIDRVVISREGELVSDVNDRIFNKEVYSAEKLRITGENVKLWGRIQSREYQKKVSDDETITKTAYEISVSKMEIVPKEMMEFEII